MAGPILETKGMRLIFQKTGQKDVLKMWAKFENILNKDRLLLGIIACNKLLKKAPKWLVWRWCLGPNSIYEAWS